MHVQSYTQVKSAASCKLPQQQRQNSTLSSDGILQTRHRQTLSYAAYVECKHTAAWHSMVRYRALLQNVYQHARRTKWRYHKH
jgi:hypothetical protein